MNKIIYLKGIKNENKSLYKNALLIYQSKTIDIVDCIIAAYSKINNIEAKSLIVI